MLPYLHAHSLHPSLALCTPSVRVKWAWGSREGSVLVKKTVVEKKATSPAAGNVGLSQRLVNLRTTLDKGK
eukprot:317073-Prorocentrum_lima.AAC.1